MQVHQNIEQLPVFNNAVITIGTFDGVHTGHQRIIEQLKKEAAAIHGETVIITFHPHPRMVVREGQSPVAILTTLDEKIQLLRQQGVDHLVVVPFNESFAGQPAEDYINSFLVARFKPHTIIIGYDHRFGKNRAGDYRMLEDFGAKLGFAVKEIPAQVLDDVTISSTRIREALLRGDIDTANTCLGYDYHFEGLVVDGNKLGRTLGYPTANLHIQDADKLVPGNGIYAVRVAIVNRQSSDVNRESSIVNGGAGGDNGPLKGMMSIGVRPTIGVSERTIEVNIFDFNEDIYGKTLRVYVKKYLRAEVKFNGLEELMEALAQDKTNTISVFREQGWGNYDNGKSIGSRGSEMGIILADFEHDNGARITIEKDGDIAPFSVTLGIYGLMFHTHFVGTLIEAEKFVLWAKYKINEIFELYDIAEENRTDNWQNKHDDLLHELAEM